MYCKHCGKQIDDNSTFCNFCGKPQSSKASNLISPKRLWLTLTSICSSILAIVFYFVTISIAHDRARIELDKYIDYIGTHVNAGLWVGDRNHEPADIPYSALVPTEWVTLTCIAAFFSLMFMLISWAKSQSKLGLQIVATILASLVTFIAIMLVVSPESIK